MKVSVRKIIGQTNHWVFVDREFQGELEPSAIGTGNNIWHYNNNTDKNTYQAGNTLAKAKRWVKNFYQMRNVK